MNKLKLVLVFVFAAFLSCKTSDDRNGYKIPLLEESIKAFINARKALKESTDILVVNLDIKKDTLALEIANTYPNTKEMKFNFDTRIDGHRIIFTGEKIQGYYEENSKHEFPNDLVKIIDQQHWLLFNDYSNWLFRYKNGKLIYYAPKEEIDQFVNISQEFRQ